MRRGVLAVVLAVTAGGCVSWLPAPVPMRTVASRANPAAQARCLVLMLPGFGDSAEAFAKHGFIDALRVRNLPVDTLAANATFGYYARRTIVARIESDILGPARTAGYEQIWLVGLSMGGIGSLLVARKHTSELAGILLVAPFLGDDDVIEEIRAAGGVLRWRPPAHIDPEDDYQRDIWRWIKGGLEKPGTTPSIYLASGDQDKGFPAHRLLGAALPPERRFRTRGAHDWGPWSILWADFLDHSDFRARCTSP